jgi:thioesterase domain-containing protein
VKPARPAHDVNAYLARHVPITQAMGIRLRSFDAAGVVMTAPLAPNLNDKGIAFGGTLASLLSLAGWALSDLVLREGGLSADVIIAASRIEYRLPVAGEIVARCPMPPAEEVARFVDSYRSQGRATWELRAAVDGEAGEAATFKGRYVARRPPAR